jgi:hypothetical protein
MMQCTRLSSLRISIFLIIIALKLVSCRKDPSIANTPPLDTIHATCELYPPYTGYQGGWTLVEDTIQNIMPYFNPNDGNEFVYVHKDYTASPSTSIRIYNISAGTNSTIWQGDVWSRPKWGKTDWIVFTSNDENIYKIKSDGTNLTQLTFSGGYHYPEFNSTGDSIMAMYEYKNFNSYIFDLNGNKVDSIGYSIDNYSNWQRPGIVVTFMYDYLHVYDVWNDTNISSFHFSEYVAYYGSVNWINSNEFLLSTINGIYKANADLTSVEKLNQVCHSIFHNGSVSPDKTKIIWERYDYSYIDVQNLKLEIPIMIVDQNGMLIDSIDFN